MPGVSPRSSFPPQGYNINYDDVYNPYGTRSGSVTPIIDEEARIRVEYMEKQLASLTGLVQKALTNPQQQSQQRSASSENRGKSDPHDNLYFVHFLYIILLLCKYP